jgi:predicted DNA-binding transcriptional regulator AlpA
MSADVLEVARAAKATARKAARERHTRETIQHFDSLPDSAHVRLRVVCALRGCSPATAWRHVRINLLPAPRKLSPKITAWNVGELRAVLARSAQAAA